jgi:hypothetical protein
MFYTYRQNNSGGLEFGPAKYVIVEADSFSEANERAQTVEGVYFNYGPAECTCCGPRWEEVNEEWDEAYPEPSIYGLPVDDDTEEDYLIVWKE